MLLFLQFWWNKLMQNADIIRNSGFIGGRALLEVLQYEIVENTLKVVTQIVPWILECIIIQLFDVSITLMNMPIYRKFFTFHNQIVAASNLFPHYITLTHFVGWKYTQIRYSKCTLNSGMYYNCSIVWYMSCCWKYTQSITQNAS